MLHLQKVVHHCNLDDTLYQQRQFDYKSNIVISHSDKGVWFLLLIMCEHPSGEFLLSQFELCSQLVTCFSPQCCCACSLICAHQSYGT